MKGYNKVQILGDAREHLVTLDELKEFIGGGDTPSVEVSIDDVEGVGAVGLTVAKATTQEQARTAIGAGTSNLTLGNTATTAKAGNYTPPNVTTSSNGLMLSTDKVKLDGIASGANNFSLPAGTNGQVLKHNGTTWVAGTDANTTYNPVTTTANGLMLATDKVKLDGLTGVTPTVAPVITVTDPTDNENIQAQFDALIASLKTAGVLT